MPPVVSAPASRNAELSAIEPELNDGLSPSLRNRAIDALGAGNGGGPRALTDPERRAMNQIINDLRENKDIFENARELAGYGFNAQAATFLLTRQFYRETASPSDRIGAAEALGAIYAKDQRPSNVEHVRPDVTAALFRGLIDKDLGVQLESAKALLRIEPGSTNQTVLEAMARCLNETNGNSAAVNLAAAQAIVALSPEAKAAIGAENVKRAEALALG